MRTRTVRNVAQEGGFLEKSDDTQENNMHIKQVESLLSSWFLSWVG